MDRDAALDHLVLELVELAAAKISVASASRGTTGYRLWEPLTFTIIEDGDADGDAAAPALEVLHG